MGAATPAEPKTTLLSSAAHDDKRCCASIPAVQEDVSCVAGKIASGEAPSAAGKACGITAGSEQPPAEKFAAPRACPGLQAAGCKGSAWLQTAPLISQTLHGCLCQLGIALHSRATVTRQQLSM